MFRHPIHFLLFATLIYLSRSDLQLVTLLKTAKHCLIVSYAPENTQLSKTWTSSITYQSSKHLIPLSFFTKMPVMNAPPSSKLTCNVYLVFTRSRKRDCIDCVKQEIPLASKFWGTMDFFGLVNSYDDACRRKKYFEDEDFSESKPMRELPGNFVLFRISFPTHKHQASILVRSMYLLKFFSSFQQLTCFVKLPSPPSTSEKDFRLLQVPNLKVLTSFNSYKVQFYQSVTSLTPKDLPTIQKSSLLDLRMSRKLKIKDAVWAIPGKLAIEMGTVLNFSAVFLQKHDDKIRYVRSMVMPDVMLRTTSSEKRGLENTKIGDMFQSFLYCKQKQTEQFSMDAFLVFSPFDKYIWVSLCISFLLMAATLLRSNNSTNLVNVTLSIMAPLLYQSHVLHRQKNALMLLWCMTSLLISSVYFGKFESFLVAPSTENTIKTYKQLAEKDYRLAIRGKDTRAYWMMCKHGERGSFNGAAHLIKLRKSAVVLDNDYMNYMKYIAKTPKRAMMGLPVKVDNYPAVMWRYLGVRCVRGTEKLYTYGTYWQFLNPYSHILKECFGRLVLSGIHGLLHDIKYSWIAETDRIKFHKAFEDQGQGPVKSEEMSVIERHTSFSLENPQAVIIFYIFFMCSAVSTLAFLVEVLSSARIRRKIVYIWMVIQHIKLWVAQ